MYIKFCVIMIDIPCPKCGLVLQTESPALTFPEHTTVKPNIFNGIKHIERTLKCPNSNGDKIPHDFIVYWIQQVNHK